MVDKEVRIWINYFDQNLSRKYGRKLSKALTVPEPKLAEVLKACEILGYKFEVKEGRYPRAWFKPSALIVLKVPNGISKYEVVKLIGRKLVELRVK
ncbi:MAG: signal recognition particle subunit SRP19/SEC65 family protein [Sulfolobales archaeon]